MILVSFAAGCGGGGGGGGGGGNPGGQQGPPATFFTNPSDSALAATEQPGGVTILGTRDKNGLPESITEVLLELDEAVPDEKTRVIFDDESRISMIVSPAGETIDFEHISKTRIFVNFTSADGAESARVPFDLSQGGGGGEEEPSPVHGEDGFGLAASGSDLVGRVLSFCGDTTPLNADVTGYYTSDQNPAKVYFDLPEVGVGVYEYTLPGVPAPPKVKPSEISKQVRKLVKKACSNVIARDFTADGICLALAALNVPGLSSVCDLTLRRSMNDLCPKLQALVDGPVTTKDSFAPNYNVHITVAYTGTDHPPNVFNFSTPATAGGVIPQQVASVAGEKGILGDVTIVPRDPDPGEGYAVTAGARCAPTGTQIRISVVGNDKPTPYTAEIVGTLSNTNLTVSLFVPGGAAEVRDVITVKVLPDGLEHTYTLTF